MPNPEKAQLDKVKAYFDAETTEHQLTILKDDGLYRHLRCRRGNSMMYGWDVITWSGHLAITGDLGDYTFSRLPDMLMDFFTGPVNVDYWLEKMTAYDVCRTGRRVSMDMIRWYMEDDVDTGDWYRILEEADVLYSLGNVADDHIDRRTTRRLLGDPCVSEGLTWGRMLKLMVKHMGTKHTREILDSMMPSDHPKPTQNVTFGALEDMMGDAFDNVRRWANAIDKLEIHEVNNTTDLHTAYRILVDEVDRDACEWDIYLTPSDAIRALLCITWARDAYAAQGGKAVVLESNLYAKERA